MRTILLFTGLFFSVIQSFSQFDKGMAFLGYKRSIPANFITGEFQMGAEYGMHFLTIHPGYTFSAFQSLENTPYHTRTVELNSQFVYEKYRSRKSGWQAGIGYRYYFKDINNEKAMIPYLGLQFYWMRMRDAYFHDYRNVLTDESTSLEKSDVFHTLSSAIQFGFIWVNGNFIYGVSFFAEYFLPVNDGTYMASDSYHPFSGNKLPFNGFEPSLMFSFGYRLY